MNYLVLDTNILHNDWNLTGTRITVLSETAARLNNKICVPMVVVDEINEQYTEELQIQSEQYNKSLKKLSNMRTALSYTKFDAKPMIESYKQWLIERFAQLGVVVLPYPNVSHGIIVNKELTKKKPFLSSQKGYRDALIWESVKELRIRKKSVPGIVYFLSENTHDFAAKDNQKLHEDLVAELIGSEIALESMVYISKIQDFIDNITNALKKLNNILMDIIANGGYRDIDFESVVKSHINETEYSSYLYEDIEHDVIAFCPAEYEEPTIENIELKSIEYTDVRKLSENQCLVKCIAHVHLDIECFVFHSDIPLFDGDYPAILDYDWNDSYAWAEDHAEFEVEYNIFVNSNFTEISYENDRVIKATYGCGAEISE